MALTGCWMKNILMRRVSSRGRRCRSGARLPVMIRLVAPTSMPPVYQIVVEQQLVTWCAGSLKR